MQHTRESRVPIFEVIEVANVRLRIKPLLVDDCADVVHCAEDSRQRMWIGAQTDAPVRRVCDRALTGGP